MLAFLGWDAKHVEELAAEMDWDRSEDGNTTERLERLLTQREPNLANLYCVEILKTAFLLAAQDHGGEIPDAMQSAFLTLGRMCQLIPNEVKIVQRRVLETRNQEQKHEE